MLPALPRLCHRLGQQLESTLCLARKEVLWVLANLTEVCRGDIFPHIPLAAILNCLGDRDFDARCAAAVCNEHRVDSLQDGRENGQHDDDEDSAHNPEGLALDTESEGEAGKTITFGTLADGARERGEVAIGVHREGEQRPVLNPA